MNSTIQIDESTDSSVLYPLFDPLNDSNMNREVNASFNDSQETIIWRGNGWLHDSVHINEGVDIHNLSAIETIHGHTPNISIHFEDNVEEEEDVTFICQINRLNSTFSFF